MANKHTAGPWVAVEVGQGGPHDNPMPVYEIRSADQRALIAEYVDFHNADILAATPLLLEALQALVKRLSGTAFDITVPDNLGPARRAIAAATGVPQ